MWLVNKHKLRGSGGQGGLPSDWTTEDKTLQRQKLQTNFRLFLRNSHFFCTESIHSQVSACAALEDNRGTACSSRRVWRLCDVIISTASVKVKTSCVQPVRVEESTTCLNFTDYFSVIKTFLHSCTGLPFAFPQQRAAEVCAVPPEPHTTVKQTAEPPWTRRRFLHCSQVFVGELTVGDVGADVIVFDVWWRWEERLKELRFLNQVVQ